MIMPIREVVNKHCSSLSAFSTKLTMTSYPSNIEMCNINNGKLRDQSASSSKCSLRKFSILSNASSIDYSIRMELNNELSDEDSFNLINSSQLSHMETVKVGESVSIASDKKMASISQCGDNKIPAYKRVPKQYGESKGLQIKGVELVPSKHISENMYNPI